MATTTTISALGALSATDLRTDDLLPIVDIHDLTQAPTGTTKNLTIAALLTSPALTGTATAVNVTASGTIKAPIFVGAGTVATTGAIRLQSGDAIKSRDASNIKDITLISCATGGFVTVGDATTSGLFLTAATNSLVQAPSSALVVGTYGGGSLTTGQVVTRTTAIAGQLLFGDGARAAILNGSLDYGVTTADTFTFIGGGIRVTGAANSYTAQFTANTTTSQSLGVKILAGTNAVDAALTVVNTVGGALFRVRGDGAVFLNSVLAWETDNVNDIGTVSANRPRNGYFGGTVTQASLRALKEQITPTQVDALAFVRGLSIVDYRYIADPDRPKIGIIADETGELLSGPHRSEFDLSNGIGLCLRALQQIAARMDTLEQRVAA